MIVTADPLGDYNATTQILRYSALAREVMVPRTPSLTQAAMTAVSVSTTTNNGNGNGHANNNNNNNNDKALHSTRPPLHHQSYSLNLPYHTHKLHPSSPTAFLAPPARPAPTSDDRVTMELAALEIARLSEEVALLRDDLARESSLRQSLIASIDDRLIEREAEVREECAIELDARLALEHSRWKATWAAEQERNEEHWDRKMDLFERGLAGGGGEIYEDQEEDIFVEKRIKKEAVFDNHNLGSSSNKENMLDENFQEENQRLRREVQVLCKELATRTPAKRTPLRDRDDFAVGAELDENGMVGLGGRIPRLGGEERVRVTAQGSPTMGRSPARRVRKLGGWE